MAEVESLGTLRDLWTGILTLGSIAMVALISKRNDKIDAIDDAQNKFEKKVLAEYATKESMRGMFAETQNTIRESTGRMEKQIDETKSDIKGTNTKIEGTNTKIDNVANSVNNLSTSILNILSKKHE